MAANYKLDFTPPKLWFGSLPIGQTLNDVATHIEQANADEVKEELERKRTEAYQAQVNAQLASVKRQDLRDQVAFDQTQQDRMQGTSQKIADLVSGGRYGAAGALAAGSRFQDPRHPGQMVGIGFEQQPVGPAPVAPEAPGPAPVAPETPALPSQNEDDYYKTMSPESARSQAIYRAITGNGTMTSPSNIDPGFAARGPDVNDPGFIQKGPQVNDPGFSISANDLLSQAAGAHAAGVAQRAQDARGQYAADKMKSEIEQRAYNPAVQAYQAERQKYDDQAQRPPVVLSYPNGQKVTIDPREADLQKEYQSRDMANKLMAAADKEPDPTVAAQMRRTASGLVAGLPSAAQGAINNAANQANAAKSRADLETQREGSQERIAGGHDRARVTAAMIRGKGGGILPGAEEARVTSEYQHNTNDITQKGGLRDQVRHQEASLSALREHPENNTNWVNAIDAMIRSNTGRAAIIQQYKLYTGKAAGADDAANQFLEWASTGALSAEQKRSLFGAMRDSYNGTVDEWNQAVDVAGEYDTDPRVVASPALRAGIARSQHATFPGGKRKKATDTTVPGLPNVPLSNNPAPAPAAASPANTPNEANLAPKDQSLVKDARAEISRKGPKAASAKAYLDHLGLQP